jgi:hypothetical protein
VNALPYAYKTVKVVETADKVAIKEAIKNGADIIGCSIATHRNLQIK